MFETAVTRHTGEVMCVILGLMMASYIFNLFWVDNPGFPTHQRVNGFVTIDSFQVRRKNGEKAAKLPNLGEGLLKRVYATIAWPFTRSNPWPCPVTKKL